MNIIQESQAQKRAIVTRNGGRVTIYRTDAPGKYPIHGCLEGRDFPVVASWTLEGEISSGGKGANLMLYSIEHHFDWDILPGWADMYIFKTKGDWVCSSMAPDWSASEDRWVPHRRGATYVLPEVVTSTILMEVENNNLFRNPKYDE